MAVVVRKIVNGEVKFFVYVGDDPVFGPATEDEAKNFARNYNLENPPPDKDEPSAPKF
jgi:hypothetical protein